MRGGGWLAAVSFLGVCLASTLSNAQSLSDAREAFAQAYTRQQYDQICKFLHPDAKFRGAVRPQVWTHMADNIITERWNSLHTCTQMAQGTPSQRKGASLFTVGESSITFTPAVADGASQGNPNYAVDTGQFRMATLPGVNRSPRNDIAGPYFIVWRRENGAWRMIHIDMKPDDAAPTAR